MKRITRVLIGVALVLFIVLSLAVIMVGDIARKKKIELTALLQEASLGPALIEQLEDKQEAVATLKRSFPTTRDVPQVLTFVETLAAQHNVIAEFHFESEAVVQNSQGANILPISASVDGPIENILAFINGLRKNRYFINITAIEGNSPQGIKRGNTIILKGEIYADTQ